MTIQNTDLLKDVIEIYPAKTGKVYLYKNLVLVEPKNGVHINIKNCQDIIDKIKSFFGEASFGIVSNRVNEFSVDALDFKVLFNDIPNIKAYGVVYYNLKSMYNVEIEKLFSKIPFNGYSKLTDAVQNTLTYISNKPNSAWC